MSIVDKDFSDATVWHREIRRLASPPGDIAKRVIGILLILLLVGVAVLNVVYPKNGSVLQLFGRLAIGGGLKDALSSLAAVFGLLASLKIIPPIGEWFEPARTSYRADHAGYHPYRT